MTSVRAKSPFSRFEGERGGVKTPWGDEKKRGFDSVRGKVLYGMTSGEDSWCRWASMMLSDRAGLTGKGDFGDEFNDADVWDRVREGGSLIFLARERVEYTEGVTL